MFHDSIRSALGKIRAGLGPELTGYLTRLAETFRVLPGPHKRYAELGDTVRTLNDSVLDRRRLEMRYRTGSTGAESTRKLDPYRVWYRSGGLYVVGYDHRSGEIRTFAVDRILEIEPTDERFEPPEDFDFDRYVGSSFGVVAEPAAHVRIRFAPSWATYVREHSWHPSQKLEPLAEGGLELIMEVGGAAELRGWVLSFGSGAEVLEPQELREEVARELRDTAALYS